MKITLSLIAILIATATFSQTNIISLRSSTGEMNELYAHKDNFGIHPQSETTFVDSLRYFEKEKMVVQYAKYFTEKVHADTFNYQDQTPEQIYEHLKALTQNGWFKSSTIFINFPKELIPKKESKMIEFNAIPLWFALLIGAFALTPTNRKKIH